MKPSGWKSRAVRGALAAALGLPACDAVLGIQEHPVASDASAAAVSSGGRDTGPAFDTGPMFDATTAEGAYASDAIAPEAGGDGPSTAGTCVIGGTSIAPGAGDPTNPCQSCQVLRSTSSWSDLPDGRPCGVGSICHAGQCAVGCVTGGVFSLSGSLNPNDSCQSCQPAASTSAWSAVSNGTACGNGQVCSGGNCGTQCYIGSSVAASGVANPANACQACQPGIATSAWTNQADGTNCGPGEICKSGVCETGCFVAGSVYASGAVNATNSCETCQPASSASTWSSVADGTACSAGQVCSGGACKAACLISGSIYGSGATNPANPCQTCQPATSTTTWSNGADGTGCGAGRVCSAGTCKAGCFVAGSFYLPGAVQPTTSCQACQPTSSTTALGSVADGTGCGSGSVCHRGACVACVAGATCPASDACHVAVTSCSTGTSVCNNAYALADYTACGTGKVCLSGSCTTEPRRYAFLSKGNFTPSTGMTAGDVMCTAEARAAGLPGTYLAALTTSTASIEARFSATGPRWFLPDGTLVGDYTALFSSFTPVPLSMEADGTRHAPTSSGDTAIYVWTGCGEGPASPAAMIYTCNDWTSSAVIMSVFGDAQGNGYATYGRGSTQCTSLFPVYCIEE